MKHAQQADPLVRDYLRRLADASAGLPRGEREDLLAEIRAHLGDALPEAPSEAETRNVLEALGTPEEIVAAAGGTPRTRGPGPLEIIAVLLLLIGGVILPVLGWLVGVVLLWASSAWTARQKWIGTLVLPGGLLFPLVMGVFAGRTAAPVMGPGGAASMSWLGILALIAMLAAPIATAVYLLRTARRPAPAG